jgi:hypothetical protein
LAFLAALEVVGPTLPLSCADISPGKMVRIEKTSDVVNFIVDALMRMLEKNNEIR